MKPGGVRVTKQRMSDMITVRFLPATREKIEDLARSKNVGMSEIIRFYVEDGLSREVDET